MDRKGIVVSTGGLRTHLRAKKNLALGFRHSDIWKVCLFGLRCRGLCGWQHFTISHIKDAFLECFCNPVDIFVAVRRGQEKRETFLNMDALLPHEVVEEAGK